MRLKVLCCLWLSDFDMFEILVLLIHHDALAAMRSYARLCRVLCPAVYAQEGSLGSHGRLTLRCDAKVKYSCVGSQ